MRKFTNLVLAAALVAGVVGAASAEQKKKSNYQQFAGAWYDAWVGPTWGQGGQVEPGVPFHGTHWSKDYSGEVVYIDAQRLERKPIRVYLLDGTNDLDNPFGNWPIANKQMASALAHMKYDFRIDWTECFHGSKGMSANLPEALRWLWR